MAYKNPWVGYIDRSYQQIKSSLLLKLQVRTPEISDLSESNILVIIVSMVAGCFEMLNLYIDNMAQESFIQTCRRLASMVRLVKLLDYRVKAASPSTADITVIAIDNNDGVTPVPLNAPYTIPAFTIFTTNSGIQFMNSQSVLIGIGETGATVPVRQVRVRTNIPLGNSDGTTPNQAFSLGFNYVFESVDILISGVPWIEVTSLGLALSTDKKFIVEVREDGEAWVIFGDGLNGAIPGAAQIVASFHETLGTPGNVGQYAINSATPSIVLPTAILSTTQIYNEFPAVGGLGYETLERIRVSAPLSLRTLDRAVTDQDYEDIARICPGVGKAKVKFSCGKTVDIYIAPAGGGIANNALLMTVKDFFEPRRMVTTKVVPMAAGETSIQITMIVTAKFRSDVLITGSDVLAALLEYGSFENQNINKPVRLSDIVAKVDNLPRVDFLTVTAFSSIPYARPHNHTQQLSWVRRTMANSLYPAEWKLEYRATIGKMGVFKDSVFMGNIPLGLPWTDPQGTFRMTILFGIYANGMQWTFKTYPFNKDIPIDDYTVPVTNPQDINIQVVEQLNPPI